MNKEITFIHAADLHLDSPFRGMANLPEKIFNEIRESTFAALDRLVRVAIEKKVDFILLVGDLFDNERQSLKAQIRLRQAFEELNKHHIQVFLSYGNHDYVNGNSYPITYPANVFVFPDETVRQATYRKNGQALASIYGFSYENQAVLQNKVAEYHVSERNMPFQIAMLHGSIHTNTTHDRYAPFQLSELTKLPFDYWALGHIHKREILTASPPVVYPGNVQGRSRKEDGEKGCYIVTLTETKHEMTFVPLQAVAFTPLAIDVSDVEDLLELEKILRNEITQLASSSPQLIHLSLTSQMDLLLDWEQEGHLDDLVEYINEQFGVTTQWYYIYKFTTEITHEKSFPEGAHFISELEHTQQEAPVKDYLSELYRHKQARKYVPPLTNNEEEEIKQKAMAILKRELLKG
ncbi:metallophosphoesterase family protein [Virgibacillus sp. MG-45]|uniref:metallophosphoesterase family protein n=1 Tax=Virgibacillus sp. MG-45 TaxID=3102791 RepID=UPI002ED7F26F